jgi:hypothetical protein
MRSKEEIKAWYKKMGNMAKTIRSMTPEQQHAQACQHGTVTCEGHLLSPFNTCFLASQAGRGLAQIGGVQQWRKVKRAVMKGQHAAGYIYVPIGNRVEDKAEKSEGAEGEGEENSRPFFKLVPVFDVSQTVEIEGGAL